MEKTALQQVVALKAQIVAAEKEIARLIPLANAEVLEHVAKFPEKKKWSIDKVASVTYAKLAGSWKYSAALSEFMATTAAEIKAAKALQEASGDAVYTPGEDPGKAQFRITLL